MPFNPADANGFQLEAGRGDQLRLHAALVPTKSTSLLGVARQPLTRYGERGENVSAGAAAGDEQFQAGALRCLLRQVHA